jgi:hypothetical protein
MRLGLAGVWSIPVVVLLGLVLAAGALSVGLACVDWLQRVRVKQLAIEDFNRFVECVELLSVGGEGGTESIELSHDGWITVNETLTELVVDGERVRAEVLPLPVSGISKLTAGSYSLELKRGDDGRLFIEARRM